jgi:LPS-assembly protein
MKNKIIFITCAIIIKFFFVSVLHAEESFNFDVTEAEIVENGNKVLGKKGGIAKSKDGTSIEADNFEYDKISNILIANGNVIVVDEARSLTIYSKLITYFKNKEFILSKGKSKAINKEMIIDADNFEYNKISNILIASGNVVLNDKIKNLLVYTNKLTYYKNDNKIVSTGDTQAIIDSKYDFKSEDVIIDRSINQLSSTKKSTLIDDESNFYKLSEFNYLYKEKFLKGENIEIVTNYLKEKSDRLFFKNGFFNLNNKNFISKNTKVLFHKELFENERENKKYNEKFKSENDPRIMSVSSYGDRKKTILNKAIFTSCKYNKNCPSWSIKAKKIKHDKMKKEIFYENAILNIYNMPVFYFPKFFHPDPSVDRKSGFLQPRLNNSDILGSSLNIPYFNVIAPNKDYTFKPTIFDNKIIMLQNEYRQENRNSSFIADFSFIKGYKSSLSNNKNSISHIFSKFNLDLGFENFTSSKLDFFLEKVNNDTYLKIFENVLLTDKKFEKDLEDKNNLTSGIELSLDHEKFNFTSGIKQYENLQTLNNDRYQYIFPYYNLSTILLSTEIGSLNFGSNGRNALLNTNNLKTNITNDIYYLTNDLYSKSGFVNNFGIYFKNLNIIAKNDPKYKSSLQTELLNIYEFNTSLPLLKINGDYSNYITPKFSFRINPSDMKDQSSDQRLITTNNIFDINRLSLTDSYEEGKSVTIGVDFKKEYSNNIEKYLEIKLAKILRDKKENRIPASSTLGRTNSNLFGSVENSFSEFFNLKYDFAIDNDYNKFEHNALEAEFKINNFVTSFNFLEKNGEMGDVNTLENVTEINFDDNNSLLFKTRRNRKISLTEYYDFIYEYQNDCLTAGIKYRKTYYQDRDLKPKEDLFFTITLFPLTSLDQKIDQSLYRNN